MFQKNDLYTKYKERAVETLLSPRLPEISKKATLDRINFAINLCEYWNTCLDIGCGSGHYLTALSAKFKKCVGIEMDSLPEHPILQKNYSNISILNTSFETYKTKEKFDFILLMDIFEHIPDIKGFVKRLSDIQTDGGIVYIVTPNPLFVGPASVSEIFHTHVGYRGHIKHYTQKELCEYMKEVGYYPEFFLFEETPQRQKIKTIAKGFSRRDQSWSQYGAYKIVRPIVLAVLKPLFFILEKYCAHIEEKYKNDHYVCMAQAIAFKKNTK